MDILEDTTLDIPEDILSLLKQQRSLMVGWREVFDCKTNPTEEDYTYYENEMIRINDILYKKLQYSKFSKSKLRLTPYMWITVSPRPDVSLQDFHKAIKKYVSKKPITSYLYVIEQRGETVEDIHGFHSHILITHKYTRPSDLQREAISTFKNVCNCEPDKNSHWFHILNILPNDTDEDVERRKEYILGTKKDDTKQQKQEIDKIFRLQNNLLDFYAS